MLRTRLPLLYFSFSVCLLTIAACGDTERGESVDEIAATAFAGSLANRIEIRYEPPKNPEHGPVYEEFKRLRPLEKLQELLSPFRLPRTLTIMSAGCDGEADAFYGDDEITICYEYVDEFWKNMPAQTTPAGIAPIDTVLGPLLDTSLHEFAHALFDMLDLPVFGREEDAADQVAAYIYLQLGAAESRRLIMGTVYAYASEAVKGELPSSLEEIAEATKAERPMSIEEFAGEHGTSAQRAYNVMCMAYGADRKVFGDLVEMGFLPRERAEFCYEEYEQVQYAFQVLVDPHIDRDLAREIFERTWLGAQLNSRPR
jgi:hypothetical protein